MRARGVPAGSTDDGDLPGLRFWRLKQYPYLVFYLERSDHIDVWRVLHGKRDVPGWMSEPEECLIRCLRRSPCT